MLQKYSLSTFHYALKENGFLILGKSETAVTAQELFQPFDKAGKIYTRKEVSGRLSNSRWVSNEKLKNFPHEIFSYQITLFSELKKNVKSYLLISMNVCCGVY